LANLVLSHADKDHMGGAIALLSHPELSVGKLWFNPDSAKETAIWDDLRAIAYEKHRSGMLEVSTALNAGSRFIDEAESCQIEIV
jgi:competence protein ComEC